MKSTPWRLSGQCCWGAPVGHGEVSPRGGSGSSPALSQSGSAASYSLTRGGLLAQSSSGLRNTGTQA